MKRYLVKASEYASFLGAAAADGRFACVMGGFLVQLVFGSYYR
jgi:hypothetical protein